MDTEEGLQPPLINGRLTNVEYNQTLVTGNFLRYISQIIQLTQPVFTKTPLIRVGQNGDGGYVIAPEFESKLVLNLGVGYEVSTDVELINKGFRLFAFDGTVPNPLPGEATYTFIQKNIGYVKNNTSFTTLRNIFNEYSELSKVDLIFLDIEGHEYQVLKNELGCVTKTKQLVVEFHGLELLGDREFAEGFINTLSKLSKTHSPVHVHANNSGGALPLGGAGWPTILEVTFLRNEFCTTEINHGPFPTKLDFPNVGVRPDIDLTPFYGVNKSYASLARTILGLA